MKEQDNKFIKNWEKTKAEGFKKYLFTQGLAFGILTTILNLVLISYNSEEEMSLESFFTSVILMIVIGGFAYASLSWLINEYIYNKKTTK